jgi:hypothetical protein
MKLKIVFGIFLLLFIHNAYSQDEFCSGTITTINGETLKGSIFYGNARQNCSYCLFRKEGESKNKEYLPEDLQSYRFDSASYYISKEIMMGDKPRMVFLEFLVKGKLNIFSYADSSLTIHFFAQKENGELKELHDSKKIISISNYSTTQEQKEYIGELALLLNDYPSINEDIDKSRFEDGSLINIAQKYHRLVCNSDNCIVFKKPKRKKIVKIGIIGECYFSNAYLEKNINLSYLGFNKMQVMNAFAKGLSVNISNFDFIGPRFSVLADFVYSRPVYQNVLNDTLLLFNQLRSTLQIQYNIPFKKFSPKISAGLIYYIRGENEVRFKKHFAQLNKYFTGHCVFSNELNNTDHEFGATLMLGSDYMISRRLFCSLNFRYEYCIQFIGYANDPSYCNNYSIQFGLGYRIN